MDTNKATASSGMLEGAEYEKKLKQYYGDMLVYKSSANSKFFSALSLPSFMRDWLVMRFSNSEGVINKQEVSDYVKRVIPKKEQWNEYLVDLLHNDQTARFLAKVKIDFDAKTKTALFSLPDFEVPKKKGEAIVDWDVIEANRDYLLSPTEVWGIVEIDIEESNKGNVFKLVDFQPFCPYTIDLDYYIEARQYFTIDEWINVLLSAIDYNPKGYVSKTQKMAMLSRLLPFVEKRINLIELAPKETGKSYVFAQISKYGWLVSGGSISRAKMFYDISKRTQGLVSRYDYVAFDEIQSIKFTDAMEMQGALKGYLESGEYRVGDSRGVGDAGLILLGNIDSELMDVNQNMFKDLPDIFHESALLDRFHGFIKGWNIPKMKESLKANGWALNTEYFGEIMHYLRDELAYRAVVDQLLQLPKNSATRDTEAIKRICTGYLKLLFPNATDVSKVVSTTTPASVGYDVYKSIQDLISITRDLRSASEMATGNVNPEDASGRAILAVQQASTQPLGRQAMALKTCIEDLGRIWIDMWTTYTDNFLTLEEEVTDEKSGEKYIQLKKVPRSVLDKLKATVKLDVTPVSAFDRYARELTLENLLKAGYFNVENLGAFKRYVESLPDNSSTPKQDLEMIIDDMEQEQRKIAQINTQAQLMQQRASQFLNAGPEGQAEQLMAASQVANQRAA